MINGVIIVVVIWFRNYQNLNVTTAIAITDQN